MGFRHCHHSEEGLHAQGQSMETQSPTIVSMDMSYMEKKPLTCGSSAEWGKTPSCISK